mgnify:CR=1 FL=1
MDTKNIHSDKYMSLKKIGNTIKEARLSKNQSVNELASNLKISEQQLNAIEEGRDDLLPEKVFVKAMIKKISENLKLDINDMMNEFNHQKEQIKIEEIVEDVQKKVKIKNSFGLIFVFNIFIAGSILFIILNVALDFGKEFKPFGTDWFVWAILLWFFLLLIHAINVFFVNKLMGKEWENQQMERLVEKQKKKIAELQQRVEKEHPLPKSNPDNNPTLNA